MDTKEEIPMKKKYDHRLDSEHSIAEWKAFVEEENEKVSLPDRRLIAAIFVFGADPGEWVGEICGNPAFSDPENHFIDRNAPWSEFTERNWASILVSQPQFAVQCDDWDGWSRMDENDWNRLLSRRPQFADRAKYRAGG